MADHGSFEYGGVRFTRIVPQEEITAYVQGLSDDRKGDIQQIVMSLESAGLLAVEQAPPAVSLQQEQEMGYSQNPDPLDVSSKQYNTLESMSPSLSRASTAQPAKPNPEVSRTADGIRTDLMKAGVAVYGQDTTGGASGQFEGESGYRSDTPGYQGASQERDFTGTQYHYGNLSQGPDTRMRTTYGTPISANDYLQQQVDPEFADSGSGGQDQGQALTSYHGGIGTDKEVPREVGPGPQDMGVYSPPEGMAYVQTPEGSQMMPEALAGQGMSRYIGQPPAPPKAGTLSASLKVDMGFLKGNGNKG